MYLKFFGDVGEYLLYFVCGELYLFVELSGDMDPLWWDFELLGEWRLILGGVGGLGALELFLRDDGGELLLDLEFKKNY